jgi:hypothetical protein
MEVSKEKDKNVIYETIMSYKIVHMMQHGEAAKA